MEKLKQSMLAIALLATTPLAMANIVGITTQVNSYSAESSNRVGDENNFYVTVSGQWESSEHSCAATMVYFNAKDNPHLVSMILAAKATKSSVRIAVDSSKPQVRGMCQVINVTVN